MTTPVGPKQVLQAAIQRPPARTTKVDGDQRFARQLLHVLGPTATMPLPAPRLGPTSPPIHTESEGEHPVHDDPVLGSVAAVHADHQEQTHQRAADVPGSAAPLSAAATTHTTDGDTEARLATLGGLMPVSGLKATSQPGLAPEPHAESSPTPPVATESAPSLRPRGNPQATARSVADASAAEGAVSEAQDAGHGSTNQATAASAAAASGTDTAELSPDLTVIELAAHTSVAPTEASNPSTPGSVPDGMLAGALAGALPASTGTADLPGTSSSGANTPTAPAMGPDVAGALAAESTASARPDRITVQLPTDEGSARIQIAISNGTVAARILMSDSTGAARLSAMTGELHDALIRQGFDTVSIAVPVPPTSSLPGLRQPGEQLPDRTPDRAPQHSFTPAQDHDTHGRPQPRARRQRER